MKPRRHYRNCLKALQNLNSKQLAVATLCAVTLWFCLFLYMCYGTKESRETKIKGEIIDLSVRYVNELAKQQKNDVDGPYSGRFTGYDLKKTFAVLLQNMLERISALETKLGNDSLAISVSRPNVLLNQSNTQKKSQNNRGTKSHIDFSVKSQNNNTTITSNLIKGAQETCVMNLNDKLMYPECDDKIDWMKKHWKSHKCYSDNGVEGSDCSIMIYLSEVEQHCPVLRNREGAVLQNITSTSEMAELNTNITNLYDKLSSLESPDVDMFMKARLQRYWTFMINAAVELNKSESMANNRYKKTIILYMGFLSKSSKLKISTKIFKGGPLGELVQWTDLLTSLHILGHNIELFTELTQINNYLSQIPNLNVPCQTKVGLPLDLIFTDIIGYNQIQSKLTNFKCILRILDTFGTKPAFNNPVYFKHFKIRKNSWMGKMLELKQFYNMFPHTSDNTFLGFIIESQKPKFPKKPIALIYGKHISMWKNSTKLLNVLKKYFEIHGTVEEDKEKLPSYVRNHGFLLGQSYVELLSKSMVFVGLGFPYEGPAPLEAIASGAVFLNPEFNEKEILKAKKFFNGKPTNRQLFRQHPYIYERIPVPYTYSIQLDNSTQIESICKKIFENPLTSGYIPYEFTEKGFLERVSTLLSRQQFCKNRRKYSAGWDPIFSETSDSDSLTTSQHNQHKNLHNSAGSNNQWPILDSAHFYLGLVNESCDETCGRQSTPMTCESSYTERVVNNRLELQQRGVWCHNILYDAELTSPSYDISTRTCYFQTDHYMFSCSDVRTNHMRFCGCMDQHPSQRSFCKTCL